MNSLSHDLVIIGAGPAGMSAAMTAASCGLKVVVLDEQHREGGQIYRNVTGAPPSIASLLGADYRYGSTLADDFRRSGVEVRFGAMVWDVARDLTVTAHQGGRSFQVRAPQLIAATGAIERATPVPGWTLPGVMNAGAAQVALKSAAAVPSGRVVLAGGGPLLLLVACQLLDAGVSVVGIVETSPPSNKLRAIRHLATALAAPKYLRKGVGLLRRLRSAGVPMFAGASELRIEGAERVQTFSFTVAGREQRLDADLVLLHHGVIPNTQLTRLLRVDHVWDDEQLAWRPVVDGCGETSLAGFRIAGDGSGIAGALAAEPGGTLAALGAARALGRLSNADVQNKARSVRRAFAQQLRIRPFLDALYRPPEWLAQPANDTVVCRCEEVTAGQVREMARLGCQGPNQTKFFSRCGMGPCQGRMCGLAVTQILAAELGKTPGEVGAYHIRAPLKPIPLASIAALADVHASINSEPGNNMSSIDRIHMNARMSKIVRHGGLVYLCGQTAGGSAQASADITAQTHETLSRIDALLRETGSDRSKILTATIYLRDMNDFSAMNAVWESWLIPGTAPARTTVEAKLALASLLVEVTVTAAAD